MKKISILLKSKRIDEAKPLMEKISNNYNEQFSANLVYRSDRLIDKILISINSMN